MSVNFAKCYSCFDALSQKLKVYIFQPVSTEMCFSQVTCFSYLSQLLSQSKNQSASSSACLGSVVASLDLDQSLTVHTNNLSYF